MTKICIVEARFYDDIADMLMAGAKAALEKVGVACDTVSVPGALEIPPAIGMLEEKGIYDGYVALGCVIRGETTHYDTVANESSRGIMDLGVGLGLAIGNGILTVENRQQAVVRADPAQKNKGAGAAEAMLSLLAIRDEN